MGTVFQRGNVWQIRYDLPPGADGKRRPRQVPARHPDGTPMSETEARRRLREIEVDVARGVHFDASRMTYRDLFAEWIKHCRATDKHSLATSARYTSLARIHVIPRLGHITLGKLQPMRIQLLITELAGEKSPLSSKTVHMIHGMLHASLAQAVKWQLLEKNPADFVDAPRVRRHQAAHVEPTEFGAVVDAIAGSIYRIPILISLATGLRLGEVIGLRWSDYDSKQRRLHVRRAIEQLPGMIYETDGKTGRARIVKLPAAVAEELDAIRPDGDAWICSHVDGRPMTPNAVGKGFRRISDKYNLGISFHGLRHSQATALILAGVQTKIVSERLGHSTVAITTDIYSHVLPDHQDESAEIIGSLMTGKPSIRLVAKD